MVWEKASVRSYFHLETFNFVNKVSGDDKVESDSESDSVIIIETPDEVYNKFIELLYGKISELNSLRNEINENSRKKCLNITLEHLVNISVSLHISIENLIDDVCNKFGIDNDQINSLKAPLDDSIPVSLFQSNLHQISLTQPNNNDNSVVLENLNDCVNLNNDINLNQEKKIFMVNKTISDVDDKDINMLDLENLGLSEETKKLLGIN
ncbi:uncharacterized protein TA04290 [Theileria annulata]|uniref:Uncharacterized protein n=1 Tax=Theileria annulata TaxID=5874 RepID=Q4UC49_THEAN|nr:uncharacterized protein TA04290 [Theileria annulata]CAI75602.1 hypothetical protein TA04290 [Theileria annulata]|eukprot:XP_955078.1 hypothetical protein TA04290 [Theileria annulata]